jgi:RNA polymerase sigma-B factor
MVRAERTAELLTRLSVAGKDEERRALVEEIVTLNMCVADAVVSRYRNRGVPVDDLRQVAYTALVRCVHSFDDSLGNNFLSYCVPSMRGEIRRHFRDQGWMVRPPRRIQELQQRVSVATSELLQTRGRVPTLRELAEHLGEELGDVTEALDSDGCFTPTSLDRPVGDEAEITLGDLLGDVDPGQQAAEARTLLATVVRRLGERDRRILRLRFFEGLTQQEIADDIGVTQMQVSRLLTRILGQLRRAIEASDEKPMEIAS